MTEIYSQDNTPPKRKSSLPFIFSFMLFVISVVGSAAYYYMVHVRPSQDRQTLGSNTENETIYAAETPLGDTNSLFVSQNFGVSFNAENLDVEEKEDVLRITKDSVVLLTITKLTLDDETVLSKAQSLQQNLNESPTLDYTTLDSRLGVVIKNEFVHYLLFPDNTGSALFFELNTQNDFSKLLENILSSVVFM